MNSFLRAPTCLRAAPFLKPSNYHVGKLPLSRILSGKIQINAIARRRCFNTTSDVVKSAESALPQPTTQSATVESTPRKSWVEKLPPRLRPYLYLMRIDKPIGTLLLFYPCGGSSSFIYTSTTRLKFRCILISVSASYTLSTCSMVNNNGFICYPCTYLHRTGIYSLVCDGSVHHAGCGLHYQ